MIMSACVVIVDPNPLSFSVFAAIDVEGLLGCGFCALVLLGPPLLSMLIARLRGAPGPADRTRLESATQGTPSASTRLRLMSEEVNIAGASVFRFYLAGLMVLPTRGVAVRSTLTLVDITEGPTKPLLVRAIDPERRGPDGAFLDSRETAVRDALTGWKEFNVGFAAEPFVHCARIGRRTIRATVALDSRFGPLGQWHHDFTLEETNIGYLEAEARATAAKLGVARFVLAIAACDGTIERRETDTIQRLFADKFNLKDDGTLRNQLRDVLRNASLALSSGSMSALNMMDLGATDIKNDEQLAYLAFEFAVQVAAADGTLAPAEQTMLDRGARALGLDDADRRRIIERFIRIDMYRPTTPTTETGLPESEEALLRRALQVPPKLRGAALASWLTAEYGKWNGRVGLPDAVRRDEATKRLELIARLRTMVG